MATIILKIDVTKIEKARLFPGKNGAKYLDVVMIETPNNQYGDSHMLVQSVTKEEREKGIKGPILGNAKTLGGPSQSRPTTPTPDGEPKFKDTDDIPF